MTSALQRTASDSAQPGPKETQGVKHGCHYGPFASWPSATLRRTAQTSRHKGIESVCDVVPVLEEMGIDTAQLERIEPILKRHGNRLFRLASGGSSYVLKVFGDPPAAREVGAYALLRDLGVPTLDMVARTNNALLLEDLAVSADRRLALEEDAGRTEVGTALAVWYRALHEAGSRLGESPGRYFIFVARDR